MIEQSFYTSQSLGSGHYRFWVAIGKDPKNNREALRQFRTRLLSPRFERVTTLVPVQIRDVWYEVCMCTSYRTCCLMWNMLTQVGFEWHGDSPETDT